ncbi:HesA/MoeB/ThiF family protein [Porticoccaceae bacterium]|nr:HesA/MoeB/ThiF family protein [Porticoccaceae bacterium]
MPLNDQQFMRYSRHLLMDDIGEEGQLTLLNARVLIVGLGGLGCPVSLYLAAAGIGSIALCDPDRVELSNLQRQVLYKPDDCGDFKVDCAKRALQGLNPEIEITAISAEVSAEVLAGDYDLVVDCTDNLAARHVMNRHCVAQKLGFVSASAIGWEGQLVAFDFRHNPSLCLNCIIDQDSPEPMMNCGNSGVVGPVLGAMGSLQATTVMRMLLGYFAQHGEMQRYDGKAGRWLSLNAQAKGNCVVCGG